MTTTTVQEVLAERLGGASATISFGTAPLHGPLGHARFGEEIAEMAAGFLHQGVRPRDRVMIRLDNSRTSVLGLLALLYAGAIPVSVKPRVPGTLAPRYFPRVARQQGIRHTFRVPVEGLEELVLLPRPRSVRRPAEADPDDIALIQYTSGSTGTPRPIPLTHRAVLGNIAAIASCADMRPGHSGLIALPLHHDMGLIGTLTALVHGLHLTVEAPGAFLRDPMAALGALRDAVAVHSAFPDSMLRYLSARLDEAGERGTARTGLLRRWRTVFCGAEPIRHGTVESFLRTARPLGFNPRSLVFSYGLAEATLLATAHRHESPETAFRIDGVTRSACLGTPVVGVEMRIVDDSGKVCAQGVMGTVQLRGETLFNGYDGITDHRTAWFDTGDMGCVLSGMLYLNGRRGDRVSINGVNVFATDIEEVVMSIDSVAECVALPHGDSFVVLAVPAPTRHVDSHEIADRVAAGFGAAPERVHTVSRRTISRTAAGKPARTHMTRQLEKGMFS